MMRLLVGLTLPFLAIAADLTITGPADVDALIASDPVQVSPYGADALQFGELRLPEGHGPFPVAIVIHGGCWTTGFATARNTAPLASALTDRGVATWNIEYRQIGNEGGGWPGTFRDWAAAADHVRSLAEKHPLDLTRVVAIGHSAGGHAALWLAARHRLSPDSEIRGDDPLPIHSAVNIDGPAHLAGFVGIDAEICGRPVITSLMGGTPAEQPSRYAQGDPQQLQPAGVAQSLVQVGVLSTEDAQVFQRHATSASAAVEILPLPEANHFDIIAPGSASGDRVIDWILKTAFDTDATRDDPRRIVRSKTDLPRFQYRLGVDSAAELLAGGPAFDALAAQVQHDVEATLRDYRIDDHATLASLHATRRYLALLRGDSAAVHELVRTARELTDKPASRWITALREDAVASAMAAGDSTQAQRAAVRERIERTLADAPWPIVGDDIVSLHASVTLPDNDAVDIAWIQRTIDPALTESGAIDGEAAAALLWLRAFRSHILPWHPDIADVLTDYIAAHRTERVDFWASRRIDLTDHEHLSPVVIAIWDEGFDPELFSDRVWSNPAERLNGEDDDDNGFIDDIHGIGFDENDAPVTTPLIDLDHFYPGRMEELRTLNIGRGDLSNGRDTPHARVFRERMEQVTADEAKFLMEAGMHYSWYAHGTMVADIAAAGNPAIRLMNIRYNSPDYKTHPPKPTRDLARQGAQNLRQIGAYLKAHGVRVVNMSFAGEQIYVERALEANGMADPDERTALAAEIFTLYRQTFTEIMRDAPEILFIAGAGNSNDDVGFVQSVPADIDLPNVLTVGATNHAGDSASFTSYGDRVRIYASGDRLEGLLPGGERMLTSGTSFAAPQVTNLAAKLLAIEPSLTVAEVIALIIDSAHVSDDGRRKRIDPRRSLQRLAERDATYPNPTSLREPLP